MHYRIKVFRGYHPDDQFNQWIANADPIEIVDFRYEITTSFEEVLAILYLEK